MESNIKIKATGKEMDAAFNAENKIYSIRHCAIVNCNLNSTTDEEINNNKWIYDVTVRHEELPKYLDRKQPYTIKTMEKEIEKLLSEQCDETVEQEV